MEGRRRREERGEMEEEKKDEEDGKKEVWIEKKEGELEEGKVGREQEEEEEHGVRFQSFNLDFQHCHHHQSLSSTELSFSSILPFILII